MNYDVLPLAAIVLTLVVYVAWRWRYRFRCPNCGRWARKRASVSFYHMSGRKKKEVTVPTGYCSSCDYIWTLKNTYVRTSGIVIPKGTQMQRPD